MSKYIDEESSFAGSEKDILENLEQMHDDIINGKNLSYKEVIDPDFEETISFSLQKHTRLANRFKKSRKLEFKSGESMYAVMKEVGTERLNESFMRRMNSTANAGSLISVLGTNPENSFNNLKKHVLKNYGESAWNAAEGGWNVASGLMSEARGWTHADGMAKRISDNIISFQVATKLGSAVLSSISDIAYGAAALKGFNGMGMMESYGKLVNTFLSLASNQSDRLEIMKRLEVYSDVMLGQWRNDLSGGDIKPGFMSKTSDFMMKITGFNVQGDSSRATSAFLFATEMADVLDGGFDRAGSQVKKNLSRYGIDQTTFSLIKNAVEDFQLTNGSKYRILTVENLKSHIDGISDASLKEIMNLKDIKGSVNQYRNQIVSSYRDYLNDYTAVSSPNPGIRERAILKFGVNPNSNLGIVLKMTTLFKTFGLMSLNVMERNILSSAGGELPLSKALADRGGRNAAITMIGQLTAFGILSIYARDLSKGKIRDPRDFNLKSSAKLLAEALSQGPGGILGDALYSGIEREDLTGFVGGPIYSDLRDIANTGRGVVKDLLPEEYGGSKRGDIGTASSKALSLAVRKLPNTWWGLNAMKTGILEHVQESLDPDYRRRYEARMDKIEEGFGRKSIFGGESSGNQELDDILKELGE